MSDYVSEFQLFESVNDPSADWSSPQLVLQEGGDIFSAETWRQDTTLELFRPLIDFPGGLPLVDEITITKLTVEARWGRGGNASSGGVNYLEGWDIGGGDTPIQFSNTLPNTMNTDIQSGDLAFWGVNQTQVKDFLNGNVPLTIRVDTASINGSTQTRIAHVKMQVEYDYVGGGVRFPRLF